MNMSKAYLAELRTSRYALAMEGKKTQGKKQTANCTYSYTPSKTSREQALKQVEETRQRHGMRKGVRSKGGLWTEI